HLCEQLSSPRLSSAAVDEPKTDNECAVPVLVVVALSGVKVCDPEDQERIFNKRELMFKPALYCDSPSALVFPLCASATMKALLGNEFSDALHVLTQLETNALSAELSGGECARAPDSLPGLTHHYPRSRDRSPSKCDIMGMSQHEASPSSSEESNSPTELNCYRRLGERAPLMKRLAMGFSGALLQPSDDDSTPLVADTPTTPTNLPLCINGGYINEASEAEARTRESNRELTPRHDSLQNDLEEFTKCSNMKNGSGSAGCSAATSSSSGASSCGGSHGSGNNNIALEVLSNQPVGAFMVRCSTTQTGCFALSVRVPRDFQPAGIAHYLILRTPKGYKIKGFTKEFTSLSALVTHHSVMPELLPCPLRLARRPPAPRPHHADLDSPHPPHTPQQTPARRHLPFRPQLDV
ncbi:hypothetical protein MSG28_002979, partial [Choristoneura fumiferana]